MSQIPDNPWRDVLHARFRGQPTPLLVLPDALWTAASLWAGTRAWTKAFRAAGLASGDCVVCAVPAGAAFVQVLLACLWEGVTFAPVAPGPAIESVRARLGARVVVRSGSGVRDAAGVVVPDHDSQPPATMPAPQARQAGASGTGMAIILPGSRVDVMDEQHDAAALLSVVRAHAAARALDGACVLSVLPWHHPFELLHGLLPALLCAEEIVRAADTDMTSDGMRSIAAAHPVTHVTIDPSAADTSLREACDGLEALGIRVGG